MCEVVHDLSAGGWVSPEAELWVEMEMSIPGAREAAFWGQSPHVGREKTEAG